MKKYQYLASWDDQTLTRVGEPVVVLGDSNVSQVEVILPSNFLLDPTKAECRMYFMLPGEKESAHDVLETAVKDENGDSHVTWTIKHVHSQKGGRLAFSLTLIGDDAQWDSRTAIIPVYESRYQPESEEAEKPYTGRLDALEGSMAAIRGEFAEVQDDFEELKETATLGTPIPESLVANMQAGHVYIYTGTESGYTAGHVYYYVNGALTDGGVYGGTAVDATLTQSGQAADAKKTGDEISQIKEDLSAAYELAREKRIANNLLTDGINNLLPLNALVYKNGTASEANYGTSGARYLIDLGDFKKCHVRFKYRHTAFHPYSGTNVFVSLASLGKNNALHVEDLFQSITAQSGQIYQNTAHYPANKNGGTTLSLNPLYKKPLIGENALIVSYTGSETISASTTINVIISTTTITFEINSTTVGTVALNASDTIQSLADAISSVNDFNCIVKNGNGTVSDLMLPAVTIPMIDSVSRNGKTVYGTKPIMVPFKIDDSWHTVEFVVNREAQEAFVAYDGYTSRVGFGTANALTDGMLAIGGNYTTNSDIEVKDLVIDINTYADCEILYGKITNASTANTRQLISGINPRLMIFEGHGILVGTENEAQSAFQASGSDTSNEAMQASTERLNIVFAELKRRGYVPVTMQEVIEWKKGIINLPKRCYLCIFDDYRLENYLDYDKRTPFVKNGVKATLAMISEHKALTDTIECNGQTYTVSDALDIVSKAEWFTASHTANHLRIDQYTANELASMLKRDVLSCDAHKMNGQVIVYPLGGVSATSLKVVANSDFTLGISIVEEYYNCKASNDYRLTRTELGTRATLESVLSPFI